MKDTRLASLSEQALECRDTNHAWRRTSSTRFEVAQKIKGRIVKLARTLTCLGCGATRTDVYAYPSFELLRRKINYPEGYLIVHVKGRGRYERPTKSEIQRELYGR
jgi:hypothetical protein